MGVAAVFNCRHVAGRVISVNLATGASRATVLTAGGRVGAAVWSSIAVDVPARRIYVTTGDPVGQPLTDVPLAQSIVALDADTLQVLEHWQNPGPGPADNSDFGASPTLFTAADGTRLVGSANKDGWLYVLRRERLSEGPLFNSFETSGPTYGAPSVGRELIFWYPASGQLRALAIPPP